MHVTLLHNTPLWVASTAIRKCWASEDKSDTIIYNGESYIQDSEDYYMFHCEAGPKDKELIHRVGNKNKHSSTLEHLVYTFDIDGISRACLQELARHRHASISVKSSRYTLKELKEGITDYSKYLVLTHNPTIDDKSKMQLESVVELLQAGYSNDTVKYALPEAYKTSLVWTVNARALQNFLELRTNKAALWEIQDLAHNIYRALPDEHVYLFKEFIYGNNIV